MTEAEAKKVGSKWGLIAVSLGLLIAQGIMTLVSVSNKNLMEAFFWFIPFEYKLNILIGALIMMLCGHLYGQLAGKQILINNKNWVLIGWLCGLAALLTTALLSGWTGFFQEGVDRIGTTDNPFEDYIFKPFLWVTLSGALPASLVGIWLGSQIKKRGTT